MILLFIILLNRVVIVFTEHNFSSLYC